MAELTKEQMEAGKKVLGGVNIFFWVVGVIIAIGLFSFNKFGDWAKPFSIGPISIGFPSFDFSWVLLALYVAALVGLHIRKGWAVPVGRAGLVVAMVIFFPVGTIFGAILWKRINDPIAKTYLNYGASNEAKAEGSTQEQQQEQEQEAKTAAEIAEVKEEEKKEDS